jgi:hypothetical protein
MSARSGKTAKLVSSMTSDRLRAYLLSVRQLRGTVFIPEIDERIYRGRSLIERLALSAEDEGMPDLELTSTDIADVLCFISCVEPVSRETWWTEPSDAPCHITGHMLLLQALEASLRRHGKSGARAKAVHS